MTMEESPQSFDDSAASTYSTYKTGESESF